MTKYLPVVTRNGHRFLVTFPLKAVCKQTGSTDLIVTCDAEIARQYTGEVEYQTASLSSIMEPLFIIVVGFLVGIIMIAMYLPMFQMGNTFQ